MERVITPREATSSAEVFRLQSEFGENLLHRDAFAASREPGLTFAEAASVLFDEGIRRPLL
jgi:hypothetical protein